MEVNKGQVAFFGNFYFLCKRSAFDLKIFRSDLVNVDLLAGHHILFQVAISEANFVFEHEVFLFNRTYYKNACFSQNANLLAHQPTHWNLSALMGEIRETTLLGNNKATMQVEKVSALMKIKFQKLNSMGTASR